MLMSHMIMETAADQSPQATLDLSSKILHLVRHAQGLHNVAGHGNPNALSSNEFLDSPLSPLGWHQVSSLRDQIRASGLLNEIDLVITSPLLRTLQTSVAIFGNDSDMSGCNGEHVNLLKYPPIMAVELCRERLGVHPCDKRRNVSEHRSLFPSIDFTLIESDEDIMWKPDVRETNEEIAARGLKFFSWLQTREERNIAIVSHHRFLQYTLGALDYETKNDTLLKSVVSKEFQNCELRSLVMDDHKRVIKFLNGLKPESQKVPD